MSPALKLILSPVAGLAFLMFLPAIGFVLFFHAIFAKLVASLDALILVPAPEVGMAALTGHESGKPANDLDEIAKEVDARR